MLNAVCLKSEFTEVWKKSDMEYLNVLLKFAVSYEENIIGFSGYPISGSKIELETYRYETKMLILQSPYSVSG